MIWVQELRLIGGPLAFTGAMIRAHYEGAFSETNICPHRLVLMVQGVNLKHSFQPSAGTSAGNSKPSVVQRWGWSGKLCCI